MKYVLLAVCLAIPAAAAAAPEAQTSGAETASKPEKTVCKRDTSVGTRLARRLCMTRAQWRERDAELRNATDELIEDSQRDGRDSFIPGDRPTL